MAGKRIVTGPVVVLPEKSTGLTRYYYQGSELPEGLDEDRVQAVIADGLVREDVDPTELTAEDLSAAGAGDRLRAASAAAAAAAVDEDSGDKRPPKTANKATWAEFRGLDEEQANDVTLEQLKDDEFMASFEPSPPEPPQSS